MLDDEAGGVVQPMPEVPGQGRQIVPDGVVQVLPAVQPPPGDAADLAHEAVVRPGVGVPLRPQVDHVPHALRPPVPPPMAQDGAPGRLGDPPTDAVVDGDEPIDEGPALLPVDRAGAPPPPSLRLLDDDADQEENHPVVEAAQTRPVGAPRDLVAQIVEQGAGAVVVGEVRQDGPDPLLEAPVQGVASRPPPAETDRGAGGGGVRGLSEPQGGRAVQQEPVGGPVVLRPQIPPPLARLGQIRLPARRVHRLEGPGREAAQLPLEQARRTGPGPAGRSGRGPPGIAQGSGELGGDLGIVEQVAKVVGPGPEALPLHDLAEDGVDLLAGRGEAPSAVEPLARLRDELAGPPLLVPLREEPRPLRALLRAALQGLDHAQRVDDPGGAVRDPLLQPPRLVVVEAAVAGPVEQRRRIGELPRQERRKQLLADGGQRQSHGAGRLADSAHPLSPPVDEPGLVRAHPRPAASEGALRADHTNPRALALRSALHGMASHGRAHPLDDSNRPRPGGSAARAPDSAAAAHPAGRARGAGPRRA